MANVTYCKRIMANVTEPNLETEHCRTMITHKSDKTI